MWQNVLWIWVFTFGLHYAICVQHSCMESSVPFTNATLTASMSKATRIGNLNYSISDATLDGSKPFCVQADSGFYIQLDLLDIKTVKRLLIQGYTLNGSPLMLNAFVLQFSTNGKNWFKYFADKASPRYFLVKLRANNDTDQKIEFQLKDTAIGRYMRLLPFWDRRSADREFCLRLQVFVCDEVFPPDLKTSSNVDVKLGEPFKLTCIATGQMQLHVWWDNYENTNIYANSSTAVSLQRSLTTNLSLHISLPQLSSFRCLPGEFHVTCYKTYSCLSNYIFHPSILQRSNTTVKIQIDFPGKISEFTVKRTQTGVNVAWRKPNLNGFLPDMLEYSLKCNTSGKPAIEVLAVNITSKFLPTNKFYSPYYCTLALRVNDMAKQYFPYSIVQKPVKHSFLSYSRRPNITPEVNVSVISSRTVRITVKTVFDRPEYGKLREYIITPIITKYGGRLPELHDIQNTRRNITVNDPHLRSYELNVKPWSLYNITVAAINNDGLMSNTGFVIVKTKEERPNSGPSLITKAQSSHSITVAIDQFPFKDHNGKIIAYRCETNPGGKVDNFEIKKSLESPESLEEIFGIHGLKPFTIYQVKCKAYNSAGHGPYGPVIFLKTAEGYPTKPRDITTITDQSNSNLLLRWQRPDPANGNITKYKIVITLKNKTKRTYLTKPDQSSIFNTQIPSVDVMQVAICAFTSKGSGESMIVPVSSVNTETTPQGRNDNIVIITTFSVAIFVLLVLVTFCFICFRRRFASSHQMFKDQSLEMVNQHNLNSSYPDDLNDDRDFLLGESRENENDNLGIAVPNYIENTRDPIPVDQFADYVRQMKLDDYEQLFDEYKNQLMSGKCYPWCAAFLPENRPKNRYNNIAAYDHSRIKLYHDCKRKTADYINANSINGFAFRDEQQQYKYISTQGPMENSFVDFWHMVWQENVNVIVMLTSLKENDVVKCGRYWPCGGATAKFDSISVTMQKIDKTADYITRTLLVEKNSTKEIRTIWHFHFVSWPDHGVPDYPTALLSLQRRVRHHMQPDKPIAIHCSAGVGRSGCFILIDAMIERIDHDHTVDILNYLRYMRTRRINMVQTFEQYSFVHEAILEYITFGNTEIVVDDLDKKTRELIRNHGMIQEYSLLSRNTQSDIPDSNLHRILLHEGRYFDAYRVDGYKHRDAFILTKAPKMESTPDFWKMCLEKQSHTIVMLNKCRENNEEYFKYWPDVDSECVYRDMTVMMNSEVANGNIITRKIKISSNKQRCEVHHFQYVDWPETDIPNRRAYSNICTLMQAVEKSQQTLGNGPIIVHAGNDYGRSGTFIAIYNSTERLKVEQLIDVLQCIRAIRIAQPKAVDNVTQYQFVYNMLRTYLEGFENYWNYKDYKVCRSPIGSTTSAT